MDRKLLFFDIDGTLLCGKLPGYIPESALDALRRAQDKGHYVFINTGRTWAYLPQAVKDYPFDGYICGCGTYIRFHDEVLYHHRIPDDIRMSLPGLLKDCRLQGVLEGTGAMYADRKVDPFPPIQMVCDAYKVYSNDTAKDFDDEDLLFEKFVIIGDSSGDADLFRREISHYFESFGPIDLGGWFFEEFVPSACSKATGIDRIIDHLGLSTDDCCVFGDGVNDVSMMNHVRYSIAMGNGAGEAMEAATYVTTPANRDGIRNGMLHYHLI